MPQPPVILGAGLTGLGAAHHLPGSVVYEAKAHAGGHVYSHEQGGAYFDEGAHICHSKDEGWVARLYANAGRVIRMDQSLVSNYWRGNWITYPVQNHLRDLPAQERIRALTGIVEAQMNTARAAPENYDVWCRGQYGDYIADNFYSEYTRKYWRVPMSAMDTDWLAGRLLPSQFQRILHGAIAPLDEKQSVFSSFHYPASGGFFSFFRSMYDDVDVRLNSRLMRLDPIERVLAFADGRRVAYDKLISTIPLNDLIRSMTDVPDTIRADAGSLRHTRLIGVNLVLKKSITAPYHWFYIYDPEIDVSRVKILSNITPQASSEGVTLLQAEIFRRDDEPYDVNSLGMKAVSDLGRILCFNAESDLQSVHHLDVSHAYPIPLLGRHAAVERITSWLQSKGIVSAGLYGRWKYVWSDQAYAAGRAAAQQL